MPVYTLNCNDIYDRDLINLFLNYGQIKNVFGVIAGFKINGIPAAWLFGIKG